jgi:hypothetical protein
MIFMKKPVRNVSLGTVENLGFGRIFYRLNAGMTFELIPHFTDRTSGNSGSLQTPKTDI